MVSRGWGGWGGGGGGGGGCFFFQAEDGIRDYKVTGVQTCALPICPMDRSLSGQQIMNTKVRYRSCLPHSEERVTVDF